MVDRGMAKILGKLKMLYLFELYRFINEINCKLKIKGYIFKNN